MTKRISVYIDGANFVYGLKTINQKYSDYHFDFEKFIRKIINKDRLIDIFYYNASLKQNINSRRFREQQKLLARLRKIPEFKIILCKRQKRFGKNDEEYYIIKGDDIHLALDMLNGAWENKYDKAILFSGDGDFAPLLRYVKNKNKKIEIVSFEKILSRNLINEADSHIIIDKKIVNKFFFREGLSSKMKLQVPFYLQTSALNCGPAALKMALEYLGKKYSIEEMEKLTEIKEGKALSTLMLAIAARKLGFEVEFYSKFFYNRENLTMNFYKKYGDMQEEDFEEKFNAAQKIGVKLHKKTLTFEKIIENIKEDRIIIVLLDWNVILGKPDYQGHFVPIVGYNKEKIYIHNHGFNNPAPYLAVEKELFEKARKSKGTDEDIIIIYKKQAQDL